MKRLTSLLLAILAVLGSTAFAQSILFVNDNDNVTYNTDTLVNDLEDAGFTFDQYSIPLAATSPDSATLAGYDLVIWYASTDGVNLGFWKDGSLDANTDLLAYVESGKKLWIIGQDLLYSMYGSAPDLMVANEFVYDYMGVDYYANQSYADDNGAGCPAVYADTTAFADSLQWIFATNWYMDGVTARSGAESLYKMGPASYALKDYTSMLYFGTDSTQVMSTFFDPALIGTYEARTLFMQQSVNYLLNKPVTSIAAPASGTTLRAAYSAGLLHIRAAAPTAFTLSNMMGQTVASGTLAGTTGTTGTVDMQAMPAGVYLLRTGEGRNEAVKFVKY